MVPLLFTLALGQETCEIKSASQCTPPCINSTLGNCFTDCLSISSIDECPWVQCVPRFLNDKELVMHEVISTLNCFPKCGDYGPEESNFCAQYRLDCKYNLFEQECIPDCSFYEKSFLCLAEPKCSFSFWSGACEERCTEYSSESECNNHPRCTFENSICYEHCYEIEDQTECNNLNDCEFINSRCREKCENFQKDYCNNDYCEYNENEDVCHTKCSLYTPANCPTDHCITSGNSCAADCFGILDVNDCDNAVSCSPQYDDSQNFLFCKSNIFDISSYFETFGQKKMIEQYSFYAATNQSLLLSASPQNDLCAASYPGIQACLPNKKTPFGQNEEYYLTSCFGNDYFETFKQSFESEGKSIYNTGGFVFCNTPVQKSITCPQDKEVYISSRVKKKDGEMQFKVCLPRNVLDPCSYASENFDCCGFFESDLFDDGFQSSFPVCFNVEDCPVSKCETNNLALEQSFNKSETFDEITYFKKKYCYKRHTSGAIECNPLLMEYAEDNTIAGSLKNLNGSFHRRFGFTLNEPSLAMTSNLSNTFSANFSIVKAGQHAWFVPCALTDPEIDCFYFHRDSSSKFEYSTEIEVYENEIQDTLPNTTSITKNSFDTQFWYTEILRNIQPGTSREIRVSTDINPLVKRKVVIDYNDPGGGVVGSTADDCDEGTYTLDENSTGVNLPSTLSPLFMSNISLCSCGTENSTCFTMASGGGSLSPGAIAGIVVGSLAGFALLIFAVHAVKSASKTSEYYYLQ